MVGKMKQHVQNVKHLATKLRGIKLEDDETFVSHDVVSLFTNTPIPQALNIISNRLKLKKDKTLKKRTLFDPRGHCKELLEFILTITYFIFQYFVFRFRCVSPIVANVHGEFRAEGTRLSIIRPKSQNMETLSKQENWRSDLNILTTRTL